MRRSASEPTTLQPQPVDWMVRFGFVTAPPPAPLELAEELPDAEADDAEDDTPPLHTPGVLVVELHV